MTAQDLAVILHNDQRGLLSIEEDKLDVLQLSADGRPPKCLLSCPTRLVLRARLNQPVDGKPRRLELFALGQKGPKSTALHLRKIHVLVEPPHQEAAEAWVDLLMQRAYPVTKPFRRVLLIVNPVGGKGKGTQIVTNEVTPLLEAAGCKVERIETTHSKHAEEIASKLDVSQYDVIATASGDGNVYEILNGLALRPDGRRALRTPIAPLPTGSACAACTNLFGPKDTFNVPLATLNVIKGQSLPVDLASVLLLPSGERRLSFLTAALGLMVDLDIGTENLRWMGDSRFMYGFVRGVVQNKPCKARLRLDVITDDKAEMARIARDAAKQEAGGNKAVGGGTDPLDLIRGVQTMSIEPVTNGNGTEAVVNGTKDDEDLEGPLPAAKPLEPTSEWVTVDTGVSKAPAPDATVSTTGMHGNWKASNRMLYMYAGLMPWVSRDMNQFPVIRNGSGAIDVVLQSIVPRRVLLNAITTAEYGDAFWEDCQHYYKVRGFTVDNLDKANQPMFTLDGEAFAWDSFHVEVLPRAANFLALDGRIYHSRFVSQPHTDKFMGNIGKDKGKGKKHAHVVGHGHGHGHSHGHAHAHSAHANGHAQHDIAHSHSRRTSTAAQ